MPKKPKASPPTFDSIHCVDGEVRVARVGPGGYAAHEPLFRESTKWRISDILFAIADEREGTPHAREHHAPVIANWLRNLSRPMPVREVFRLWCLTLPFVLRLAPPATGEEIAQKLVSEAQRLNVPRRG